MYYVYIIYEEDGVEKSIEKYFKTFRQRDHFINKFRITRRLKQCLLKNSKQEGL